MQHSYHIIMLLNSRSSLRKNHCLWVALCLACLATHFGCHSLQLHPNVGLTSSELRFRSFPTKEIMMSMQHNTHATDTRLAMAGGEASPSSSTSFVSGVKSFTQKNSFLLSMAVAVAFAKLFPNVSLLLSKILFLIFCP